MSGLTRTQLESWRPEELAAVAKTWRSVGSQTEALFNRYVSSVEKVNGEYWSGDAAEAAHTRALADRKTATTMVDKLESLAAEAEAASHELSSIVRTARDQIAGAEASMFRVSDNFTVTDSLAGPDPERDKVRATWQASITEAALAAFNTDLAAQQKLAGHRADLIATFTDSSSLGGESGSNDGKALSEHPGELTDSQERRLIEAGRLTPEQLAALHDGNDSTLASISASQMEYINAVNRSLDGKSPQEIRDIVNKLPPDARAAFANMEQIGSNSGVTATVVGDKNVPTRGGLGVLPRSMQKSLMRGDLVQNSSTHGVGYPGSGSGHPEYKLNGVADNKAIAEIVGAGGDQYKADSDVDKELMKVGRTYLHAQVMAEQADGGIITVDGKGAETSSPVTESIFSSIGADKAVVDAAVNNQNTGMQFIDDVLTHDWSDDGRSAGSLFRFEDDVYGAGAGSSPDAGHADRIFDAVSRAIGNGDPALKLMTAVPGSGDNAQSVGDLNPLLLRDISSGVSHYIPDLAGGGHHPGFFNASADDYRKLTNLFAVMNTDEVAGQHFNSEAMQARLSLLQDYGHNRDQPGLLTNAGTIAGTMEVGNYLAQKNEFGTAAAAEAYARRVASFDLIKDLSMFGLGKVPGVADVTDFADKAGLGASLRDIAVGPAPTSGEFDSHGNKVHMTGANFDSTYYTILHGSGTLPQNVIDAGGDLVDRSTGRLKEYSEFPVDTDPATVTGTLGAMFTLYTAQYGSGGAYSAAYEQIRSTLDD